MIYVGIDVGGKEFQTYAVNARNKVVHKGPVKGSRTKLRELMKQLGKEQKYVVVEAGNQMKWIADTLRKIADVTLHVVHPNEIKWISESSGKTDKIDARKLAHLARANMLPRSVHIVEGDTRKLRELTSARHLLQAKRVSLINAIRGWCRQEGEHLPEKFFQREGWDLALKRCALSDNLKAIIQNFMMAIESLKDAEENMTADMNLIEDERTKLLETIPAIGKLTARVLVGAIDDAKRFDAKKSVAKYGALVPGIYQSGSVTHLGRIAPNGRHEIRRVLLQCAHTITRMKAPEVTPLLDFFRRVEKKSGKKKAVVALARRLLTTAYGVLKSGKPYDPKLLLAY